MLTAEDWQAAFPLPNYRAGRMPSDSDFAQNVSRLKLLTSEPDALFRLSCLSCISDKHESKERGGAGGGACQE